MSLLLRLIIFPILLVRRILWPMLANSLGIVRRVFFFFFNKILIYLIAFFILYFFYTLVSGEPEPVAAVSPSGVGADAEASKPREKLTSLPAITGRVTDGNSSFAKPIPPRMSKPDLARYSAEYHYVMTYIPAGEPYLWKNETETLFGKITAGTPYQSKNGVWCRPFEEVLVYHQEAQNIRGIACRRADGSGWCKLRPESTPNCELGYNPTRLESFRQRIGRWF
jgi:surface antigen